MRDQNSKTRCSSYNVYDNIPASILVFSDDGQAMQSPFHPDSLQHHALGEEMSYLGDVYRYGVDSGSGVAAGRLCQEAAGASDHTALAITTVAAGQYVVTLTNGNTTPVTANMFAEGVLNIDAGTHLGNSYRIRSNTAAAINATFTVTLYDALATALTNGDDTASLARRKGASVLINPAVPTGKVFGVAKTAITASYYAYYLIRGRSAALTEGTAVIGQRVVPSATADGAVAPDAGTVQPCVGEVVRVESDGQSSIVDFDIK